MSHGPEHHIEHAEHAQHATHDPFDKRVTVSIAIVAAVLAGVTMMGHRAHNETLRLQGESLRFQTEAGTKSTDTANQYAFYQAKKNRGVLYGAFLDFTAMMPLKAGTEKTQEKDIGYWQKQQAEYAVELPDMLNKADEFRKEAAAFKNQAAKALDDSHEVHLRADRYDFGELFLQLGVVLCSLAILTRSKEFWYLGLLASALGLLVAVTGTLGLFMGAGHHAGH